jgi:hypothetical protein
MLYVNMAIATGELATLTVIGVSLVWWWAASKKLITMHCNDPTNDRNEGTSTVNSAFEDKKPGSTPTPRKTTHNAQSILGRISWPVQRGRKMDEEKSCTK